MFLWTVQRFKFIILFTANVWTSVWMAWRDPWQTELWSLMFTFYKTPVVPNPACAQRRTILMWKPSRACDRINTNLDAWTHQKQQRTADIYCQYWSEPICLTELVIHPNNAAQNKCPGCGSVKADWWNISALQPQPQPQQQQGKAGH